MARVGGGGLGERTAQAYPGSAYRPSPRAGSWASSLGARLRLGGRADREGLPCWTRAAAPAGLAPATMLLLPSAAEGQGTAITRALTSGTCPPARFPSCLGRPCLSPLPGNPSVGPLEPRDLLRAVQGRDEPLLLRAVIGRVPGLLDRRVGASSFCTCGSSFLLGLLTHGAG